MSKIALQLDKENKFKNKGSLVIKEIMATRGWTGLFIGYFGIQYRQTSWTAAYFASLKFFSDQSKVPPRAQGRPCSETAERAKHKRARCWPTPCKHLRTNTALTARRAAPGRHP